jgi:hypothetical protein
MQRQTDTAVKVSLIAAATLFLSLMAVYLVLKIVNPLYDSRYLILIVLGVILGSLPVVFLVYGTYERARAYLLLSSWEAGTNEGQETRPWWQKLHHVMRASRNDVADTLEWIQLTILSAVVLTARLFVSIRIGFESVVVGHLFNRRPRQPQEEQALDDRGQDTSEGEDRTQEQERARNARKARKEAFRSAVIKGWELGKKSWVFVNDRVIPTIIWPAKAIIERCDAIGRFQENWHRRRPDRGPIQLED